MPLDRLPDGVEVTQPDASTVPDPRTTRQPPPREVVYDRPRGSYVVQPPPPPAPGWPNFSPLMPYIVMAGMAYYIYINHNNAPAPAPALDAAAAGTAYARSLPECYAGAIDDALPSLETAKDNAEFSKILRDGFHARSTASFEKTLAPVLRSVAPDSVVDPALRPQVRKFWQDAASGARKAVK